MIKIKRDPETRILKVQFGLIIMLLKLFGVPSRAFALKYFMLLDSHYWNSRPMIDHEAYHCNRQKDIGFFKYLWEYKTNKKFLFTEELNAHAIEIVSGTPAHKALDVFANNYDHGFNYIRCRNALKGQVTRLRSVGL